MFSICEGHKKTNTKTKKYPCKYLVIYGVPFSEYTAKKGFEDKTENSALLKTT
jgi:hypothetical protein